MSTPATPDPSAETRPDIDRYHRMITESAVTDRIPEIGMAPRSAYRLIESELTLDGNPRLNLASYVTTVMEPEADELADLVRNKNLVDKDEYPSTEVIQRRVMTMVGDLCGAPDPDQTVGTATVGSSEAIMLGLLAHKWSWRARQEKAGKPTDRPNMVFGSIVHTCWEKAAKYFDIEQRIVPVSADRTYLNGEDIRPHVDENTIAVGAILGNTFTGQVDDIGSIDAVLKEIHADQGWFVPIHVDGASGGFVAPFAAPDYPWDFRLEHVRSINVSNHKFGLVYAGMGSVVFPSRDDVPDELVFDIDYLGGSAPTYSLNFSQSSVGTILQYYNFLRLGRDGYGAIISACCENARHLEGRLDDLGHFTLHNQGSFMPVLAFSLTGADKLPHTVYDISDGLRARGWIVPAYPLPADAHDTHVLRVVVKDDFTRDLIDRLVDDLDDVMTRLGDGLAPGPQVARPDRHARPIC